MFDWKRGTAGTTSSMPFGSTPPRTPTSIVSGRVPRTVSSTEKTLRVSGCPPGRATTVEPRLSTTATAVARRISSSSAIGA